MTREEMIASLKADHGIDVEALQSQANEGVALSNAVRDKLTEHGLIQLSSGSEATQADLLSAVDSAAEKIVELTSTIDTQRKEAATTAATAQVDELISAGRVLPKDKDAMIELRLSNEELFDKIVPEKPLVELSREDGTEPIDAKPEAAVNAEILRLSNVAKTKLDAPIVVPA